MFVCYALVGSSSCVVGEFCSVFVVVCVHGLLLLLLLVVLHWCSLLVVIDMSLSQGRRRLWGIWKCNNLVRIYSIDWASELLRETFRKPKNVILIPNMPDHFPISPAHLHDSKEKCVCVLWDRKGICPSFRHCLESPLWSSGRRSWHGLFLLTAPAECVSSMLTAREFRTSSLLCLPAHAREVQICRPGWSTPIRMPASSPGRWIWMVMALSLAQCCMRTWIGSEHAQGEILDRLADLFLSPIYLWQRATWGIKIMQVLEHLPFQGQMHSDPSYVGSPQKSRH